MSGIHETEAAPRAALEPGTGWQNLTAFGAASIAGRALHRPKRSGPDQQFGVDAADRLGDRGPGSVKGG